MAEIFCLTRESNIFDQIVPDQDDLFLGPGDGPVEGHAPPKGGQAWYTKHVSKSSVYFPYLRHLFFVIDTWYPHYTGTQLL